MNTKPVGRVGRSPVISVRVRAPLHKRIVKTARASGRSLSEEIAVLLERGFEWTDRHGNRTMAFDAQPTKIAIAKLDIEPGDIALLKTDMMLNQAQRRAIAEGFRPLVPEGVRVAVLSMGISLDVLKKAS
jgi:hypothetical protein